MSSIIIIAYTCVHGCYYIGGSLCSGNYKVEIAGQVVGSLPSHCCMFSVSFNSSTQVKCSLYNDMESPYSCINIPSRFVHGWYALFTLMAVNKECQP